MAGFTGQVFECLPGGGVGHSVSSAQIRFIDPQTWQSTLVQSKAYGLYQAELRPGWYIVRADHPDFLPFSIEPELVRVGSQAVDLNILLRRRIMPESNHNSLFYGRVLQHWANGQTGYAIPEVAITFINTTSTQAQTLRTDEQGCYQIELAIGSYLVTAFHPDFKLFSSEPGLMVLRPQPTVANFFLELPQTVTTHNIPLIPNVVNRSLSPRRNRQICCLA